MQILIIQTAFLGDVILTTPVIEVIKKEIPESFIDFLTIPASQNIVEKNPNLRQIIVFDKKGHDSGFYGLKKMGQRLSSVHYDICLTPHRSWRSAILTKKTNAAIRVGFNRSASPAVFTHIQQYHPEIHEIERNLSLLKALEIESEIQPPRIYPSEADQHIVESRIKQENISSNQKLFALAPGSVWPTKRWPSAYFVDLTHRIEKLGYRIFLIGGSRDKQLCEFIKNKSRTAISAAGEFTLRQTYYFLTKCSGLVSNDSAPLHLGLAAQIPLYAIFGATVPAFGFAPFGPESVVLENKNLACRPCAIHGGYKCPTKTFDCMNTILPDLVEAEVLKKKDRIIHG